jgi:site-specific DNA recombinase
MKKPIVRKLRCAVYTRKSTEEGLDMEFNSLDAQREACEAYVASQKPEGWLLLPDQYDDGGFSGGTLERPALQRLIADIEAGRIDIVVVYKIDRLSRSLMDFAKLVEVFDRNNVTFVSVTQSFNTTTSMGRLTLNILLSFAQFEREVISERIRDKFAASRKKGMWMGGFVPLGYDVKDRKLIINKAEAATVRMIFERFIKIGSATELVRKLRAEGVRGKQGKLVDKGYVYSCSITSFTSARQSTRASPIPANTKPSSTASSGIGCIPCSGRARESALRTPARRRRRCSRG